MTNLEKYEQRFPTIAWREPAQVRMPDASGLACRVCIAEVGLRADQTERLFTTREDFDSHFVIHLEGQAPSPGG